MSKGIIVLDGIPENCFRCRIKRKPARMSFPEDMVCGITGQSVYQYNPHNVNGNKPDWCPIKLAPEKKPLTGDISSIGKMGDELIRVGWNACLDEIFGSEK